EAARKQAEHYGVGRFIEATSPSPPRRVASENTAGQPVMPRATTLLAAVAWAVSLRVEQVIWPAQCADETERLTQTIELVTLVHHLAMLEHDPVPTIQTPLLEMGDRDLIELGVKLDVPWRLAWTCQLGADVPCLACE